MNSSRRKFLKKSTLLAGGASLLSQYSTLSLIGDALAEPEDYAGIQDYKSLVCIFLPGGNDGINMFVPTDTAAHAEYADLRGPDMTVPLTSLLGVNNAYGFNPAMQNTQSLYTTGKLAVVSNVGALIEPITREQFYEYRYQGNQSIKVPDSIGSHSHQTEFWQKGTVAGATGTAEPGWGGKMADLLIQTNGSSDDVPISMSIGGGRKWFDAVNTIPVFINRNSGLQDFAYLNHPQLGLTPWWDQILNEPNSGNVLENQFNVTVKTARQRIISIQNALLPTDPGGAGAITTSAPNALAKSLLMVARMIAARQSLGMHRQLFFVTHPGAKNYDTHSGGRSAHESLLTELDVALDSFHQTMQELETRNIASADSVTAFTASEFGRSLRSNGNGTDHGWGSHHLVMGGAVTGGQVYGILPDLSTGSSDDAYNILLPSTSLDQYGATLAKWMGINDADLSAVFLNLDNFSTRDLGFMV